uniref:Phospholipid/glycerol acyltransferase domain-containing protein n=1 Tax=Timema genevievae TaxID=629358 RepID=A0A7R9K5Z1_TIMGE|nr:unnamed protein product [Timema genevievae]
MNITVKGRQVTRKEAPILVVAPHSTFLDASITYVTGFPSIIVRRESGLNPFIGNNYSRHSQLYRADCGGAEICTGGDITQRSSSAPVPREVHLGDHPEPSSGNPPGTFSRNKPRTPFGGPNYLLPLLCRPYLSLGLRGLRTGYFYSTIVAAARAFPSLYPRHIHATFFTPGGTRSVGWQVLTVEGHYVSFIDVLPLENLESFRILRPRARRVIRKRRRDSWR